MGQHPTVERGGRGIGTAGALLLAATMLVALMAASAGAITFSNPAAITIPAGAPSTTTGVATPYPSPITVSGTSGAITDVNVTLNGVTHTNPDDIDILLVGPGGQNVVLMSDCGAGAAISGVVLTFDDAAAASLPDTGLITSGTYKPTQGVVCVTCGFNGPPPAPVAPYGTTLSVFNGLAANGTWNLYVYDDAAGDVGSISGGWTLDITGPVAAPTITSFTPTSGPVGTMVTITGTNFTGATSVAFGGVAAAVSTVVSPTQITAKVPTGAVTGPIVVTTPAGTATSATNFTVTISSHARHVSLNLPGNKAKGLVTVTDGFTACAAHVPVKIQHLVSGKWRNVASLKTTASGGFRVGGVTAHGKYRALAKKVTTTSGDICKKAMSPTVRN